MRSCCPYISKFCFVFISVYCVYIYKYLYSMEYSLKKKKKNTNILFSRKKIKGDSELTLIYLCIKPCYGNML